MKTLIAVSAAFLIAGCGSGLLGGTKGDKGGGGRGAASAILTWNAPTTSADGSQLSDLAGYRVYYGNAAGSRDHTVEVGNVLTATVADLPSGTHYFAVTAYDASGNESLASNEASKVIP